MTRTTRMALLLAALAVAGCTKSGDKPRPFRLGYFPNITHGQALVGKEEGRFAQAFGPGKVELKEFNAGPAAMEALVAGDLDASYVGPGPAINTYLKAGKELRVIAGAASGGAMLVTKSAKTPQELKGKRLASPQLGNTQDIALRHWLSTQGLKIGDGPDAVSVTAIQNPDILALFQQGSLEGAWVPEPWGARLIAEGGGQILVDESTLWPNGRFPTTVLVTTQKVMTTRPGDVKKLLEVHAALTREWTSKPDVFTAAVGNAFGKLTSKPMKPAILQDAFSRMHPTTDPDEAGFRETAKHAQSLGYLNSADVQGLIDLSLLRSIEGASGAGTGGSGDGGTR